MGKARPVPARNIKPWLWLAGIIVLLDRRVISKGYGRNFLDSQPYPIAMQ